MAIQASSDVIPTKKNALDYWLKTVRSRLAPISPTAALDARVLLSHTLSRSQPWVLSHPEYPLSTQEIEALELALKRLLAGEPLPYVLGRWSFFGMEFELSPDVLIPRPETELLVERALDWLSAHPRYRLVADLGTGSGCIAVALAAHTTGLQVLATDISWGALQIARANAQQHLVADRVSFVQGDLLAPFSRKFNLICANLPYIPSGRLPGLEVYQREPTLALDGGPEGLSLIRRLMTTAPDSLAPAGLLLLEIEADQGPAALALARQHFPGARIEVRPDLAGRDRLLSVEKTARETGI